MQHWILIAFGISVLACSSRSGLRGAGGHSGSTGGAVETGGSSGSGGALGQGGTAAEPGTGGGIGIGGAGGNTLDGGRPGTGGVGPGGSAGSDGGGRDGGVACSDDGGAGLATAARRCVQDSDCTIAIAARCCGADQAIGEATSQANAYGVCLALPADACRGLGCAKLIGYTTDTGKMTSVSNPSDDPLGQVTVHCSNHICTTDLIQTVDAGRDALATEAARDVAGADADAPPSQASACQDSLPAQGTACASANQTCYYESCAGSGRTLATCTGGAWSVSSAPCSPAATVTCTGTPSAMSCPVGQVCLIRISGTFSASCANQTCGTGPVTGACVAGATTSCTVNASVSNGATVTCNECPSGSCAQIIISRAGRRAA